jgi:hypothetical protein
MNNEILETHKRLEKNGYAILGPKIFGLNKPMLSALNEQLEKLIVELDEANDQPGALRYHLDNINTIKLISPWLNNHLLCSSILHFFETPQLKIKYIRFREPLRGLGLQKWHYDWYFNSHEKRLEIFILFDQMNEVNGCTEIKNIENGNTEKITASEGSLVLMDSRALHRGTRNKSGERRRVISLQISPLGEDDDRKICNFPLA